MFVLAFGGCWRFFVGRIIAGKSQQLTGIIPCNNRDTSIIPETIAGEPSTKVGCKYITFVKCVHRLLSENNNSDLSLQQSAIELLFKLNFDLFVCSVQCAVPIRQMEVIGRAENYILCISKLNIIPIQK